MDLTESQRSSNSQAKSYVSRLNTEYSTVFQSKQNFSTEVSSLNQSSLPNQNQSDKNSAKFAGEKIIGNGSFGVVYQARVIETGEVIAVKKVLQDRRYKNRELQLMQELDHPNIIKLKYSFNTQGETEEETYQNLVMDYVPETLYRVFKHYKKKKQPFPNVLIKLYAYQLLRGLAYIHSLGICHRDVKPQNVLIDPVTNVLKLCDFGSAKRLVQGENNVAYICSRFYRAPELIFGATNYTTLIDIWSAGCVIAEIMLGEPIFPGESAMTQLVEIIKILGAPSREQILEMNPKAEELKCPNIKAMSWKKVFSSKTDPKAIDLISKLIVYEPNKRLHPLEALLHPYFDELRDQNFKINGSLTPALFNFTQHELAIRPDIAEKLVPSWYKTQKGLY